MSWKGSLLRQHCIENPLELSRHCRFLALNTESIDSAAEIFKEGFSRAFFPLSVGFFANQLPYFTCTAGFWSVKILKRSANDRDCKKPLENGRRRSRRSGERCRCSQESWREKSPELSQKTVGAVYHAFLRRKKSTPAIFNSRFDLNLEGR